MSQGKNKDSTCPDSSFLSLKIQSYIVLWHQENIWYFKSSSCSLPDRNFLNRAIPRRMQHIKELNKVIRFQFLLWHMTSLKIVTPVLKTRNTWTHWEKKLFLWVSVDWTLTSIESDKLLRAQYKGNLYSTQYLEIPYGFHGKESRKITYGSSRKGRVTVLKYIQSTLYHKVLLNYSRALYHVGE